MNRKKYLIVFMGMIVINLLVSILVVSYFPFGTRWADRVFVTDERGIPRIRMEVLLGISGISLFDETEEMRGLLIQDKKRGIALRLSDSQGNTGAELFVAEKGHRALILRDTKGKSKAILSVSKEGYPHLAFEDGEGNTRISLGLEEGGKPKMIFYNQDREIFWQTP